MNNTLKARLFWVMISLSLLFISIALRLSYVSLGGGWDDFEEEIAPSTMRGNLLDRKGRILAGNVTTFSAYVHPSQVPHKEKAAKVIHQLFPSLPEEKARTLLESKKSFLWLVRHMSPEKKLSFQALGIPGVHLQQDYKRVYPYGSLFCHVLGFTDIEQTGISGMEKFFNVALEYGDVQTSLDVVIQHSVHQILQDQMEAFQAVAANAMVVHIATGEILAMVSLPEFSPGSPVNNPLTLFNRNVSGAYEFGSIMKIHNVALFLESGKGTLSSVFDASYPLRLGRFLVTDFKGKNRPLTVKESFIYSSNIANAKMAMSVGGKGQQAFFQALGFHAPVRLELSESAKAILPKNWRQDRVATASYGYGFAVTPLHVLQSLQVLVSGYKVPLTLLKRKKKAFPQRLLSNKTVEAIQFLLEQAVKDGQAQKARAANCTVGAKTGTANLRIAGRYCKGENLTSCVGVFPAKSPEYMLLVSIERPKANASTYGYATAGWIAAPVISKIVEKIAPLLGVLKEPE